MRSVQRVVAAFSLLGLPSVASAQGTSNSFDSRNCYYPNSVQSAGSPCFPDQAVSPCCGPGFICLSNGLCEPGPDTRKTYHYTIYRSSCTDQTWNSTSCPQVCLSSEDNLDAGQGLATCGTGGSYCCGRGYDCCSNATNIFTYGAASAVTTIPYATSSTSSASASSTSSSSSSSSSSSTAIGVGVGVGVGVFAILCAAVVFILARRRKAQRHGFEGSRAKSELPGSLMVGKDDAPPAGYQSSRTEPWQNSAEESQHQPSPLTPNQSSLMTPGTMLNPAEMDTRQVFEMEEPTRWKDPTDAAHRHEMGT